MKNKTGIYIHVPFCLKKCVYCDFFSQPLNNESMLNRYAQALQTEIQIQETANKPIPIQSVYWGGGTPSLLDPDKVFAIMEQLRRQFVFEDDTEITMEFNPAAGQRNRLRKLVEAGVNRISLGAQSFFDDDLKLLGRVHDSRLLYRIIEDIHAVSIKNFNIDLIFGLPGQNIARWESNLHQAVLSAPSHISAYLLQLEESVPMYKQIEQGRYSLPDDDLAADLYDLTRKYLSSCGFTQYEISNFAQQGKECKHNILYWQAGDYQGFGAGAVSSKGNRRSRVVQSAEDYIGALMLNKKPDVDILEEMDEAGKASEALILGLRLCEGIYIDEFNRRFNMDLINDYERIIKRYESDNLLHCAKGRLYLAPEAYFISNYILADFLN
ncbi:MAG: radical SAM family heme chaperone HemW [Syntrophomonadaceae bacterium]|jgi:oxygen-independent coproporphyrinogen-3 oxidase|nr:radical SAM family heme chaperone HemW [Syntrophomonadaceae bacterium]